MGASVFYPSGGLMDTGLFTSQRNRPEHLERLRGGTGRASMTFTQMKELLEKAGRDVKVADLDELGEFVVDCVTERRYVIARDLGPGRAEPLGQRQQRLVAGQAQAGQARAPVGIGRFRM